MTWNALWESPRHRVETITKLCMRIGLHGVGGLEGSHVLLRRMYRRDPWAFAEIMEALCDAGMERHDVLDLVGRDHDRDCACWRCVLALNARVVRTEARRRV